MPYIRGDRYSIIRSRVGYLWHAGKVLGGESDINGMLYVRGDRYNILP
jgi:hypothetical protein